MNEPAHFPVQTVRSIPVPTTHVGSGSEMWDERTPRLTTGSYPHNNMYKMENIISFDNAIIMLMKSRRI
jgi:hypothetical protein